ncbi:MAG TPA: hypothetical protein VIU41_04845 [Geobacteraceae bacterium]
MTALPDLLGKLGSEHFSAEVQRTHIALLKEQFGVLERENKKLASEKAELKAENKILKAKNKVLEKENLNLKIEIESHKKPPDKKWAECPKCLENDYRFTGDFAPAVDQFFANAGVKFKIFKCESCGYTGTGK